MVLQRKYGGGDVNIPPPVALIEMLKLVEDHELAHCRDIMARAQREARQLLHEAHAAARERMRRHVQELKHLRDTGHGRAEAEVATAHRQQQQRRDRALLDAGWARMRAALAARWHEPVARRRWVENLAQQALARLPRGRWSVTCPAEWERAERAALAKLLESKLGAEPEWIEDRNIAAGLRFCVGGACLDGTFEGLLADRAAVEAMLLAELHER